jgi:hypothetical protein
MRGREAAEQPLVPYKTALIEGSFIRTLHPGNRGEENLPGIRNPKYAVTRVTGVYFLNAAVVQLGLSRATSCRVGGFRRHLLGVAIVAALVKRNPATRESKGMSGATVAARAEA